MRTPSFLLVGGYLVQVEAVDLDKTLVFWCLFFDGETDAVVVPFLDRKTSIPNVFQAIETNRDADCVRIDPETIVDYVVEVMNYELARGADVGAWEAGLLVNDLEPHSRTFGVLDWPTPLLEIEKQALNASLSTYSLRVRPDTSYSLVVETCMLERDALVWREFRIFTKDNPRLYDRGKKGQVLPGKREPQVLVVGLPDNCRAQPGASLGVPQVRFTADPEGWESIQDVDASFILSDLNRRIKPVLDPTQLGRWSRQHLTFYDLDLLKIEPENSDETRIAYILWKPGFALPLDSTSSPMHQLNEILGAERQSKSGDGRVIRTAADAARYVVFFGRHVWGGEEPFMVLKSKDDNAIGRLDLTDAEFDDRFDSIGAALAAIVEPAPREVESSGDQPAFEVPAWVLYGNTIFMATFKVLADGSIEMTDDEPMVSAQVKGGPYPPYLPLESVSEPAELMPLRASEWEKEFGQLTVVENRVLTGQLTRETLHVRIFRHCRFRGRVNLRLLTSDRGLSFEECIFENGLDLSGANLKGEISIKQCLLVEGWHHPLIDTAQPFSFDNLSANGLQIEGLWSTGSLSAKGVRIHGAVQLFQMTTLGGIDLTGLAAQSLDLRKTQAKRASSFRAALSNSS